MRYIRQIRALEMFLVGICITSIRYPNLYPMYLNTVQPPAAAVGMWKILPIVHMLGCTIVVQVRLYTNQYLTYEGYFVPKWVLPWIPWMKVVNAWVPNIRYLNLYLMYPNTVLPNWKMNFMN